MFNRETKINRELPWEVRSKALISVLKRPLITNLMTVLYTIYIPHIMINMFTQRSAMYQGRIQMPQKGGGGGLWYKCRIYKA